MMSQVIMHSESGIDPLNCRLRRLERRIWSLKAGLVLALCALVGASGAAFQGPRKAIRAVSFSLKDAKAELASDPFRGESFLYFAMRRTGRLIPRLQLNTHTIHFFGNITTGVDIRATLQSSEDETFLGLRDKQRANRVVLAVAPGNFPVIGLRDAGNQTRIAFIVDEDGAPSLKVADWEGRIRASVKLQQDGAPALLLSHLEGTTIAVQGGQSRPAAVSMSDRSGRDRLIIESDPEGNPTLKIVDRDRKTVFQRPDQPSPTPK